jgi:hypothetical protein
VSNSSLFAFLFTTPSEADATPVRLGLHRVRAALVDGDAQVDDFVVRRLDDSMVGMAVVRSQADGAVERIALLEAEIAALQAAMSWDRMSSGAHPVDAF